ncbi:MAG: hypothetical protein EYC70_01635 [Planctomycetota bacterium]|nr:MAG: hypothetical protein EYC70_01635 [Planctomycetota bacterium]
MEPMPSALLLGFLLAVPQLKTDAEKAAELIESAERLASKGEYHAAYQKYLTAMARYPETDGGRTATRRIGQPSGYLGCADMERAGPSANRVDVVVMGDGYMREEQESFDRLARYVPDLFRQHPVLGEYYGYHNFIRCNLFSAESGVGGYGREKDTALRAAASGLSSGQVAVDGSRVHRWLAELPEHDGLVCVFVPSGSHGTGGGGIATLGGRPDQVVYHEWGHAFAGLADEYDDDVGYTGPPGEAPNLATTDDPKKVPWRHWLDVRGTEVGIHRGGGGRVRGTWKPSVRGCAMNAGRDYCPVCREQIVLNLYRYVDPIDAVVPDAHPYARPEAGAKDGILRGDKPHELGVTVLQPKSHELEVRWWVLPAEQAPPPPAGAGEKSRSERGPLAPLEDKPAAQSRRNGKGEHAFKMRPDEFEPGLYRVVCRVRDTTEMSGDRLPWVLKDDGGLLESECGWWVLVEPELRGR